MMSHWSFRPPRLQRAAVCVRVRAKAQLRYQVPCPGHFSLKFDTPCQGIPTSRAGVMRMRIFLHRLLHAARRVSAPTRCGAHLAPSLSANSTHELLDVGTVVCRVDECYARWPRPAAHTHFTRRSNSS